MLVVNVVGVDENSVCVRFVKESVLLFTDCLARAAAAASSLSRNLLETSDLTPSNALNKDDEPAEKAEDKASRVGPSCSSRRRSCSPSVFIQRGVSVRLLDNQMKYMRKTYPIFGDLNLKRR